MKKHCKTCGLADLKQQRCKLSKLPIDPLVDYCSRHDENITYCETCHQQILKENTYWVHDIDMNWHCHCIDCIKRLSSCAFCKKARTCAFESDPSPIPKMIQKQVRQGNQIFLTEVVNPARTDITCKNGCDCYDAEKGCLRENNYCERIDHVYGNDTTEYPEVH